MIDQGAGDGDALLLAAGKPTGCVVSTVGEAHQRERFFRAFALVASANTGTTIKHRQLDVLERGGAGEQVEALKHEPDIPVPQVGEFITVQVADAHTIKQEPSAGRAIQTAERVHHRALSGTARPHDGDELAGLDRQRDPTYCVDFDLAADIGLAELFELDDRRCHVRRLQI